MARGKISEEQIEQILRDRYSGNDAALGDLADLARDVKAVLTAVPDDATRATHLLAISEAAAELDETPARASKPARSFTLLRRTKFVFASLVASLVGKIALVGVAVAATTGGLAATGSLPDAAQDALARAGEKVGIQLPAGDGHEGAGVPDELPEPTEGSSAPSVLDVIRSWDDDKGCEFGHAVATAAGGQPGPCHDEEEGDDSGLEGVGKPEGTPKGQPEGAGKPEGTPQGKPAGAGEGQGKPEGTPDGQPDGAGKPEGTPGGGSASAGENGSGDTERKDGTNGSGDAGPPSDLPVGDGNGSAGGPPSSVPSGRP
jgi:hypothetical protein